MVNQTDNPNVVDFIGEKHKSKYIGDLYRSKSHSATFCTLNVQVGMSSLTAPFDWSMPQTKQPMGSGAGV